MFEPEVEMVMFREMLVKNETGFRVCSQRPHAPLAIRTRSLSSRAAAAMSGYATTAEITAIPSAPAAITSLAFCRLIPADCNNGDGNRTADLPEPVKTVAGSCVIFRFRGKGGAEAR